MLPSQLFEEDFYKISGKQMNIIYITTRCNLACEYCFEEEKRTRLGENQRDATTEEIDKYIDTILKREGNQGPLGLLFFGGEPLLRMDLIEYTMDRLFEKIDGKMNIMLESNGILLPKYINKFIDINNKLKNHHNSNLRIQISYDGPFSDRRLWRGSKLSAKKNIEEALEVLKLSGIQYAIAYTVNKSNINTFIHDLIYLMEIHPNLFRFSITWCWNELIDVHPNATPYQLKDILQACYLQKLFKIYKKYMCPEVCSVCNSMCKNSKMTSDVYLVPGEDFKARPKYNLYKTVFFQHNVNTNTKGNTDGVSR